MQQWQGGETVVSLPDGLRIALKRWGPVDAEHKILCLHGWLDNAATWDTLAPLLLASDQSVHLACMEFTGHGLSSHRSIDSNSLLVERVLEVVGTADALGWKRFSVMGHSMGAAVACLVAGTIPKRVNHVIFVDGLGPWPRRQSPPEQLRLALQERSRLLRRQPRVYPSFEVAVTRYLSNVKMKPSSARLLVRRATQEVDIWDDAREKEGVDVDKGPVTKGLMFRHDPRLKSYSVQNFSEADTDTFIKATACPALILLADNEARRKQLEATATVPEAATLPGTKSKKKGVNEEKTKTSEPNIAMVYAHRISLFKDAEAHRVEGTHHLHLDNPERIAPLVIDFLAKHPTSTSSKL